MKAKIIFLVAILIAVSATAEPTTCSNKRLVMFSDYLAELRKDPANSNTAQFYNLKYLSNQMIQNNIAENEVPERLINYIANLDSRYSTLNMYGYNVVCSSNHARGVFQLRDINDSSQWQYVIVRFYETKIINISLEDPQSLFEGKKIQDLELSVYASEKTKHN